MEHELSQNAKIVALGCQAGLSAGDATLWATYVDCAGWERVLVLLHVGALVNTKTLDMHIHEGDTTSPATDITGAALVQIVGDANGYKRLGYAITIDRTKGTRKRYILPVVTAGADAACGVAVTVILTRGEKSPADAAASGLTQRVNV
jgi:hypothetical protein